MKARYWVTTVAMALGGVAVAADINPSQLGASCPAGSIGTYHFVNNQTGGAGPGLLSAVWTGGSCLGISPYSVLANTQHFSCSSEGVLTSASTNLPGKLVLSDFSCTTIKPPPCEGKGCEEPPPPK